MSERHLYAVYDVKQLQVTKMSMPIQVLNLLYTVDKSFPVSQTPVAEIDCTADKDKSSSLFHLFHCGKIIDQKQEEL